LFTPESHIIAGKREFWEETWYHHIDITKLVFVYKISELKYTDMGNRWLKDRQYYIYQWNLGPKWRKKESPSEKSQWLQMIENISLEDALAKQEEGIVRKLGKKKRQTKLSTTVANRMAFQEINKQIQNGKIRL
jgi:hypothetical protein